jgi:hypothetical protein
MAILINYQHFLNFSIFLIFLSWFADSFLTSCIPMPHFLLQIFHFMSVHYTVEKSSSTTQPRPYSVHQVIHLGLGE